MSFYNPEIFHFYRGGGEDEQEDGGSEGGRSARGR